MNKLNDQIISWPWRKADMFQRIIDVVNKFQKEWSEIIESTDAENQKYYQVTISENQWKKTTQYKVYNYHDLEEVYNKYIWKDWRTEIDTIVASYVETINTKIFTHYTSWPLHDLPWYDEDFLGSFLDFIYEKTDRVSYDVKISKIKEYIRRLRKYDLWSTINYFFENPIDMINPYAVDDPTMAEQNGWEVEIVYVERSGEFMEPQSSEYLKHFLKRLQELLDLISVYENVHEIREWKIEHNLLHVYGERKIAQIIFNSNSRFKEDIINNSDDDAYIKFINLLESPIGWDIVNRVFSYRSYVKPAHREYIKKIISSEPQKISQYLNDLYSAEKMRNIDNDVVWEVLISELEWVFGSV